MIEFRDVAIAHGPTRLLQGVSLSVRRATFVGVAGPNGSGKTSLLRVAARLLAPTSGSVLLDGRPLCDYGCAELARKVAAVWQRPAPAPGLTARQLVMLGRTPHLPWLRWETRADEAIVDDALAKTDASHLADRPTVTLSAGELQRVFIAVALAQRSQLLLLDEPTSQLDASQSARLSELIERLASSGMAILCASHDVAFLDRHGTSVALLAGGRVRLVDRDRSPAAGSLARACVEAPRA